MSVEQRLNDLIATTGGLVSAINSTQAAVATQIVGVAQNAVSLALITGGVGNPYPNAYAATLPKGVTSTTITTAGTGGTSGTYALGISGGPVGFAGTYTISGGGVTAITITNSGLSTTTTAPTLSFPSGSVAGAAATATVSTLIADQKTYWVASADSSQILLYGNNAGSVATAPFGGTQIIIYGKTGIDAYATSVAAIGRPPLAVNLYDINRATAGQAVNTDGTIITSAGNTVSDLIPVIGGASYVFPRRPGQWAFYNTSGAYITSSYATPSSGGIFTGSISGNQLTITATTTGSLAVGTPIDVPSGGGLEIQSGGSSPYTLNNTLSTAVPAGTIIYGGAKITAPVGAAFIRFSQATANTDLARQGLFAGSALPALYTAAAWRDPSAASRDALDQALGTVRRTMGSNRSLLDTTATIDNFALALNGPYSATGFLVTPFIQTNPTDQFITNFSSGSNGAVWYDETQRALLTFTITSGTAFGPPPAGARFFRTQSSALATKSTLRIYAATTLITGLPGFPSVDPVAQARLAITQARAALDAAQPNPRQLFNKDDGAVLIDNAISNNGATYSATGYAVTGFIEITGGIPYISNYASASGQACYYDENFAILNSGTNYSITANTAFTPPSGAYWMRRSIASWSTSKSDMYVYRAAYATGKVFFGTNPTAGDTLTINPSTPVTITFVASGATGNQVNIGADTGATSTALQTFINANTVVLGCTAAVGGSANTTILTSNSVGPGGNTIIMSRTGTAMTLTAFAGALPLSTASKPFGGGSVPVPGLRIGFIGNSQTANGYYESEVVRVTNGTETFRSGNPGKDIGYLADTVIPTLTASIAACDVIFFQEGHNEWNGAARPLGSISDSNSANTTYGKLKKAFDAIYAAKTSILLFVGGPTFMINGSSVPDTSANSQGVTGTQIDDAMRAVAQSYGASFIELRRNSNFNSTTIGVWTGDNLHWNLTSGPRIGRIIGGIINGNA